MRAVCYARVSSAAQRERDTIASQLRILPEFVARQGWELVRPASTYVDDGRSAKAGKLAQRAGLTALLRDAALGAFDVVAVMDIDRLTRAEDLAERGLILGALQQAGVRVASAIGGELMDLNSDHGDLLASLKAYVAAADNRKRAERIRQGKLTSALRGGKQTGPDPYGLRYDKPTNTWSIDPVRGPIVAEIFRRAAAGESCIAIASDLALRGVPSSGKAWTKWLVRGIVRATYPIGDYVAHRATRTMVAVPPIVDVALWQRAQDALTAARKNGLRRTKYVYLLEGLAVCGICGAPMRMRSRSVQKGRWVRPAAYICTRRQPYLPVALRTDAAKCTGFMRVEQADAAAWAAICRELEDPELPAELAAERREIASDARAWEADADGYRAHLARLDQVGAQVLERFRRGLVTEAMLDKELAALRRERAAVRAQLQAAEKARGQTINAQARLGEASATIQRLRAAASPEERREIALTLLDPGGVVIFPDEIRLELLVERPASSRADSSAMVAAELCSDAPESHLRIRVLARLG